MFAYPRYPMTAQSPEDSVEPGEHATDGVSRVSRTATGKDHVLPSYSTASPEYAAVPRQNVADAQLTL